MRILQYILILKIFFNNLLIKKLIFFLLEDVSFDVLSKNYNLLICFFTSKAYLARELQHFRLYYRLNLDIDMHVEISRYSFQYLRHFFPRILRDFCNARCIIRSRVRKRFVFRMQSAGKWDTNVPRKVCEGCHTSSLHSRWRTSPTLLGATARSCREQCRQTTPGPR